MWVGLFFGRETAPANTPIGAFSSPPAKTIWTTPTHLSQNPLSRSDHGRIYLVAGSAFRPAPCTSAAKLEFPERAPAYSFTKYALRCSTRGPHCFPASPRLFRRIYRSKHLRGFVNPAGSASPRPSGRTPPRRGTAESFFFKRGIYCVFEGCHSLCTPLRFASSVLAPVKCVTGLRMRATFDIARCFYATRFGFVLTTLRRTRSEPRGARTAMCVQNTNDQCVLQFTLLLAAGCVLHRRTSRAIHHRELSSIFRGLRLSLYVSWYINSLHKSNTRRQFSTSV